MAANRAWQERPEGWVAEYGIDDAIINEIIEAADRPLAEAMRLSRDIAHEVTVGGPLGTYLEKVRKEAIQAVKLLVVVPPTDSVAVLSIQARIGAYLNLVEFIANSQGLTSPDLLPEEEPLAEDHGDRQEVSPDTVHPDA
jgi:hypothetical protein